MIQLLLIPLSLLAIASTVAAEEPDKPQSITRIWLTHNTNDYSKIVANWMSDRAAAFAEMLLIVLGAAGLIAEKFGWSLSVACAEPCQVSDVKNVPHCHENELVVFAVIVVESLAICCQSLGPIPPGLSSLASKGSSTRSDSTGASLGERGIRPGCYRSRHDCPATYSRRSSSESAF